MLAIGSQRPQAISQYEYPGWTLEGGMQLSRRQVMRWGAGAVAAGAAGFVSVTAGAQGKPIINMQLRWVLSGNQLGETFAQEPGLYEPAGNLLPLQAGGPPR